MNLRQLRYFTRIAETENMTRAAETLNVAQTALGFQVKNLEAELGVRLIERHSRGVRLTGAGALFNERLHEIFTLLETAVSDTRRFDGGHRPMVYVGLTPSMMTLLGPTIFEIAQNVSDRLTLRFVEDLSFNQVAALERDDVQLALAFNVPESPDMVRKALLDETLFMVTSGDPAMNGVPVSFQEVIGKDLALLSRKDIIWNILHDTAAYLSLEVNVAFEVQSSSAIKALVERGVAVTVMPYGSIAEDVREGRFCARPIDDARMVRTLFLISRRVAETAELAGVRPVVDEIVRRYGEALGPFKRLLVDCNLANGGNSTGASPRP